jgi:hypothetical protein
MTWQDKRADSEQLGKDYAAMQSDPNFMPELSKYRDTATAIAAQDFVQKARKEAQKTQLENQFAPAWSRYQADVYDPLNKNTPRAEIAAFQMPEDLRALAAGSATAQHMNSLTGTPSNEEYLLKNQQTAADKALNIKAEAGLSQLFGPSATPEKYPGTLGNIPFDASLAYNWAAQNNVPPETVQPIIEQFRKNYDTTYGPMITDRMQVGNAQKEVKGNYNALGEFKKFEELATHPPQPKVAGVGGTMGLNINGLSDEEQAALGRAINNGLDPYKVNSKTGKIYAQQELLQPGRKWNELGATAAFERNAGVMNTKALLNTIDPLLNKLVQSGAILGNSNLPGYNKAVNFLKEQTGSSDIVGFNNLRDDVVAEVERGLLGSGVLSDSKYNRAIKNINSAQSLPQLKAAVENTRTVIQARLEALAKGPISEKSPVVPLSTAPANSGTLGKYQYTVK